MTGADEREWERWREAWRRPAPGGGSSADVERRAAAERRRVVIVTGVEIAVGLALVAAIADVAPRRRPVDVLWVGAMAALLGLAWAFALGGPGGRRVSLANTTEAFLRLTAQRCRRTLRALRYVWLLLGVEAIIHLSWARGAWRREVAHSGDAPAAWVVLTAVALAAAVGGWAAWRARRVRARLARVEAQLAELVGGESVA